MASFNVLNYFTTFDDGSNDICGPAMNLECRGADNGEEFQRQNDKIVAGLAEMDADVVGLIEIQNDSTSVEFLVSELNQHLGDKVYAALDTGPIGTDAIKVGIIYKPVSVSLAGNEAILDGSADPRFIDDKNRPALAQTFETEAGGSRFTQAREWKSLRRFLVAP